MPAKSLSCTFMARSIAAFESSSKRTLLPWSPTRTACQADRAHAISTGHLMCYRPVPGYLRPGHRRNVPHSWAFLWWDADPTRQRVRRKPQGVLPFSEVLTTQQKSRRLRTQRRRAPSRTLRATRSRKSSRDWSGCRSIPVLAVMRFAIWRAVRSRTAKSKLSRRCR